MEGVLLLLICLLLSRFSDAQIENMIKFQDTHKPSNQYQTELLENVSVYRQINGSYNNPININWGEANTTLVRVMPANYGPNGEDRRAMNGLNLPNPRLISRTIFLSVNRPSKKFTLVTMQWGQVLAHDMSFSYNLLVDCCADPNAANCIPIKIPPNDTFYSQYNQTCLTMVRTNAQSSGSIRDPISIVTHFIDASFLYGSDLEIANVLRQFKGGLLKVYINKDDREFLPLSNGQKYCSGAPPDNLCFESGDLRTDQNIQLTSLLVVILREHNRIARALSKINPCWDDERLYQESRRIVIGIFQHITYKEWLPSVIGGTKYAKKKHLLPLDSGYSNYYDVNVNPTTINSFATVAYRLFHSAIQGQLWMVNSGSKCPFQTLNISDYMNRPGLLTHDNYLDASLNGLTTQTMQNNDRYHTVEMNGKFGAHLNEPYGSDLTSLDIQRGRDHGMPCYNEMRKYAGLCAAETFEDLIPDMGDENVRLLKKVYTNVADIDAFVGCSLENPVKNCLIGPTARRLIVEQLSRKKFGDRFWYENGNMPSSFTLDQLDEIRKVSLSRILCDNGNNITEIQRHSFQISTDFRSGNQVVKCSQIPAIDLTKWYESPSC